MMNLTPATAAQKRALLEANLNQAARLLLPQDKPATLLFNLTMIWAFALICALVIPVILVAIMAIGLALFPIMFMRALVRHKPKPAIILTDAKGNRKLVATYDVVPFTAEAWKKSGK